MKISFIDPPVLIGKRPPERVFGCTYGLYPIPNIFILQVAALLKKEGHDIKYNNFPLDKVSKTGFIEFIKKDESDIYCIYSVNLARGIDLSALEIIRKISADKIVIFFGPAPTYNPSDYLVDDKTIVVRGEPEITFLELINAMENKIKLDKTKGISYSCNGQIQNNPGREINRNLDALPFPDRELINADKYFNPKFRKGKFTAVLTSRGCPYRCRFCVPCSLSFAREVEYKKANNKKPEYITRSAENVIEEFQLLKKQGYKNVAIIDDEFTIDKKRVIKICNGIKNLGIEWGCLSRADNLNEETVKEMGASGCRYIDIGVESFTQDILDDIKKNLKIETVTKAIRLTKKYNIFTKINIMFGSSPMETKATIEHTLKSIKSIKPDAVMFGICNPFPGTQYYNTAKEQGWFVKGDYFPSDVQNESTITLPNISKKELEIATRRANLAFFLNPMFIAKNISKVRSPKELLNKFTALKRKLF